MPERWRPLSKRQTPESEAEYDRLHDDIPQWLAHSVLQWVVDALRALRTDSYEYRRPPEPFGQLERRLRITLDRSGDERDTLISLCKPIENNTSYALDLLDCLLDMVGDAENSGDLRQRVRAMLDEANFAWTVAEYGDRLERRLDETVTSHGEKLMSVQGRPSQHLREAWQAVYSRNPDAKKGYGEAIRAVEAATIPIVQPNHAKATLGTVIGQLNADSKSAPEKWPVVFNPSEKGPDPLRAVIDMMNLLWTSQQDRHGTPDESVPPSVSLEEAEAALQLAITIVAWFQSGAVSKKS